MTKLICIVIPIFKTKYLANTIESLNNQTSNEFKVYLCNDNSPDSLSSVVSFEKIKFEFEYITFENNLGGKDLVGQWERCISLTKEDWIWVLGDDDFISNDAVESLYNHLILKPKEKLNRFSLEVVNEKNETLGIQEYKYSKQSTESFVTERLYGRQYSSLNEYVFSRNLYLEVKGFVNYPLGWCSDDATWIEMSKINDGISNIVGGKVFWRQSQLNISSKKSIPIKLKKIISSILFINDLKKKFSLDEILYITFFSNQLKELEIKGIAKWLYLLIFRKFFI